VKLRGQLVLSHLGSIVATALVIGVVNVVLLVRMDGTMERQGLDGTLSSAAHLLSERVAELQRARDELVSFAAASPRLAPDPATLGKLHDLLALYQVERVEIFGGSHKLIEAYRWERGASPELATTWPPAAPQLAPRIAFGEAAMWVQCRRGERAALKVAALVPGGLEGEREWVVVTEPLDGTFIERIMPSESVGALLAEGRVLVGWPQTPTGGTSGLAQLADFLPDAPLARFLAPVAATRAALRLDDGSSLDVGVIARPIRGGQSLLQGLRVWFLVTVAGALAAFAVGSGLASRLLSPLNALLEGTAAMARGHLMVRLSSSHADELGALTREFNRMSDEIRNTYLGVISTLAEIVEAKSEYTRQHIERVEQLCLSTADVLERRGWVRFSSHQRFLLSVAAILHDIGKISIANEILDKNGPLDMAERAQILSHPEVGALIVERMGKLERAAEIIRCAHEHFDGSGYPRGLRGEEIPLEARIILAVDAFDAMTVDRPYSTGRPAGAAVAELREQAGRQFDPVVVEALIEVVTQSRAASVAPSSDSGLYRVLHDERGKTLRRASRSQADRG
jgi:HAMP domain-containing protein